MAQRKKKQKTKHQMKKEARDLRGYARDHETCAYGGSKKHAYSKYKPNSSLKETQVHHVLPVAYLRRYWKHFAGDTQKFDWVKGRYEDAEYCVHAVKNLRRMPTLETYQIVIRNGKPSLSEDLPAHLLDHHKYNDEVYDALVPVWNNMAKPRSGKKCARKKQVRKWFQSTINDFTSELKRRGERSITVRKVVAKFQSKQQPPKNDWWTPFSMANDGMETKLYALNGVPKRRRKRKGK
jgi:hypothetical protein